MDFKQGDLRKHIQNIHKSCNDHKCDSCGIGIHSIMVIHIYRVHEGKKYATVNLAKIILL